MNTMNLIIVDDKQLMAGSFSRYLKHRFGRTVNINTATNASTCLEKISEGSKVIVLDYPLAGETDTEHGASLIKAIKEQKPDTDVVVLTSPDDARKDMVKSIKLLERMASKYIIHTKTNAFTSAVSSLDNAIIRPIKIFAQEHGIGQFMGLFFAAFMIIGLVVFLAEMLLKL